MPVTCSVKIPKVVYVNKMPPIPPQLPVIINVSVLCVNGGTSDEELTASNSCEVSDWWVNEKSAGGLVGSEPPESECLMQYFLLRIPAKGTKRADTSILLDGWWLSGGKTYVLTFVYFGLEATAEFEVVEVV